MMLPFTINIMYIEALFCFSLHTFYVFRKFYSINSSYLNVFSIILHNSLIHIKKKSTFAA